MQIYTRTGDHGTTRIIGGRSVYKNSAQVEAYGTVDELNSLLGMLASHPDCWSELQAEIMGIQQLLFDCGNDLATPEHSAKYDYRLSGDHVTWLESRIDEYSPIPPAIESFILPGGSSLAALIHFARTVTRRAERCIVSLQQEQSINTACLKFVNRLSDYFFALARLANHHAGVEDVLYERSGKVFHNDLTKDRIPK